MATKQAAKPAANESVFAFRPTEAPVTKNIGAGRPPNPEMVKLIAQLDALPLSEEGKGEWFEFDAPDVTAFRRALNMAGLKLNVSFMSRTDVKPTEGDEDDPGVVKFCKIPRRTRTRKEKGEANGEANGTT